MTVDERDSLAERFEEHRAHLRGVAYRMLGSLPEAEEAVQDSWLRVSAAGTEGIENLRGWLTTIVARVCLNMLRARKARPESAAGIRLPDPIVTPSDGPDPERDVVLADEVGLALQVVLETLAPAERVAFVLHDMFDVSFEEIGPMLGRSSTAARQLASRARRRVRGAELPTSDRDLARQREVVDAFFAAAHRSDFDGLMAVLHPDVVLRSDGGPKRSALTTVRRGAAAVAEGAITFRMPHAVRHPVLINGAPGVVVTIKDRPFSIMGFTVADGRIVRIDAIVDPDRLPRLTSFTLRDDA